MKYLKASPLFVSLLLSIGAMLCLYTNRVIDSVVDEFIFIVLCIALFRYRHTLARAHMRLHINPLVLALLSSLPFMLFEENINCLPSGCVLVPVTIPFLLLYLFLFFGMLRLFRIRQFWIALTLFSTIGLTWEMTIGVSSAAFLALPPLWIFIIGIWTWLSYAFIGVVPLTILYNGTSSSKN